VLTKEVRERTQKLAISKQLQTHYKAKFEKGVGTPFPRVLAPLHTCSRAMSIFPSGAKRNGKIVSDYFTVLAIVLP